MKCPDCNETLLITERHNIEIDYCPACRGVWLDKGELDKCRTTLSVSTRLPQFILTGISVRPVINAVFIRNKRISIKIRDSYRATCSISIRKTKVICND